MKSKLAAIGLALAALAPPAFAQDAPLSVGQWVSITADGVRSNCPYTFHPDGSFTNCNEGVRGEWTQDDRQVTLLMYGNRVRWLGALNGERLETFVVQPNGLTSHENFVRR